jgi:hypothetical protein
MTLSGITFRSACALCAGLLGGCAGGTIDNYPPGLLSHGTSLEHTIQQPMKSAGTSAPATGPATSTTAAMTARSTGPGTSSGHGGGGNGSAGH